MFNDSVIIAAKNHALAEWPKEACGLVVADEYIPCENIAVDPLNDFEIASEIVAPYIAAGTLQAIIHSHPHTSYDVPSSPSKNDMQGQIATNVPWGVIDTDGTVAAAPWWWGGDDILEQPLLGRTFHHGIRDCYSLIRAYFWQKRAVLLPDFARGDGWWAGDENLYVDNFASAGFVKINRSELTDGDLVLGKVISNQKISHAGVYLDNREEGKGLLLHHLPGRLSCRQPAGPYINRAAMFLRYAP